jgi:ubiquinol-cytochrome c reductase cytochrome c subunit
VTSRFRLLLRRSGIVLLLAVLAGSLNLAVAVAQDEGGASLDPELVERGDQLFQTNCAMCHGSNGTGLDQEGPAGGPSLIGVGPASVDFMIRSGRMPMDNQNDRLRRGPAQFDDTDRAALVAYVTSLAPGEGPAIPDVSGWQSADLARGLEQFTTNCAACHGPTAAGVAVGQRDVSSNLDVASPLEIAEAIRTGPGVMPVFGGDVLGEEDLEAVTAWVMELRDRESPGGISVGRSGPVSEGFIAWLVGLGLLDIVMYLLGEKAGDTEATDE